MSDFIDKIKEKPFTVLGILFVILFWMLVPLIAQKYFNTSAITVSFAITVLYFVSWKAYENRKKILEKFR